MLVKYIQISGETRTAWAKRLGVSKSYLSDILNGNRQPGLNLAARIERETDGAVPATSWVPMPNPADQPPAEDAA